ncbi:MAG TPA: diacylglycerol kinase family protein [Solirubrobacteraceae bacterium]|nr:diacylglycerol kinase family protein [Solirubrobacteraceae bacterium]
MSATDLETSLRLSPFLGEDAGEPRKRLLLIVNPYASTVSDRLRNLVVSALRGSYEVDAIDTERREHATELCREAAQEGYDGVVAFGGDGTVNEAANGLAGTGTPLSCLPGGRANVYCRMLGIPTDVVDATEHLLSLADHWHPRPVDLGRVGARHFLFSAGVGLDANVVAEVDAHPRLKTRLGQYYYAWVATLTYGRRYLVHPPRMETSLGVTGVTVLIQNAAPYTYFGNRSIEMASGAKLDSGDLSGLILKRSSPLDIPSIAWRALSRRAKVSDHPQVVEFNAEKHVLIRSLDDRELPVQVDGDFIGTANEYQFSVVPGGLTVVA